MGDSFGAVVARLPGGTGLARLAGPSTAVPWRYASPGQIWQPAQGPDGTIYAIEEVPGTASNGQPIDDLAVVVIDGQTGQLRARVPIARDFVEFHAAWEGRYIEGVGYCHSGRWETRPHATNPIVGEDGSGYFEVSQITRVDHGYCQETNISRLDNHSVRLVKVTPAGVVTEQDLYRFIGPYDQWFPEMGQVLPDGLGGIVATWGRYQVPSPEEWRVTRFDGAGQRSDFDPGGAPSITLMGDAGTAYLYTTAGTQAMDVTTWTPKWMAPIGGYTPMAIAGGGVVVRDSWLGDLSIVDETGVVRATVPMPIADAQQVLEVAEWIGLTSQGVLASVKADWSDSQSLAQSQYVVSGGNPQRQSYRAPKIFNLVVNTFIPEEWVDNPVEWLTEGSPWFDTVFGGDGRAFAIDGSSRTHQTLSVSPFGVVRPSRTVNGRTTLYDKPSSVIDGHLIEQAKLDTTTGDAHWLVATDTTTDKCTALALRLPGEILEVRLRCASANPLVVTLPYTNTIDYDFRLIFNFSTLGQPTVIVSAEHDAFPNYELYLNGVRLHEYEHPASVDARALLWPNDDVSITYPSRPIP
jgi:hypothetical protein